MVMETYLDIENMGYTPNEFSKDFNEVLKLSNRLNAFEKDSEAYLYMYSFFREAFENSLVSDFQLIEKHGENYKEVLKDWDNYATPKGISLYRKSGFYFNRLGLFSENSSVSKGNRDIFSLFLKARPKRPLTKARNIQGLKSNKDTMAQRELIKELLMTEINQKTNHIDLKLFERFGRISFKFKVVSQYRNHLNVNLLDMSVHSDVKLEGKLPYAYYEYLSGVDPTKIVLTRNPKKLINNLLTYINNRSDLKKLGAYTIRKQLMEINSCVETLKLKVSDEELYELFTYCDSAYNSETLTKVELSILKSLGSNNKLNFTDEVLAINRYNTEDVTSYTNLMALYVISAVNNNTGLTSDSTLESIPQDIIDFSVKHVDEIVVELINYVNVLEKYGYAVTD